jgi:tetratricopeptide (TPR) repeat protein
MKQYKTVFVFIAFFCIYQSTNAQTDFPALSQQFIDYRKANKQDSALYIARKMNQLALKEQSDTSFWYALSMRAQGFPYYNRGDYDSTLYYWKKAVDLFKEYHPNHSEFASSLNHLGVLYKSMGDYKAAAPYYEQALAIFKQSLGENHPDYAMSL